MIIGPPRGLVPRTLTTCRLVFFILVTAGAVGAQSPPSLKVTAPANNAVAYPGSSLTITIDSLPSGTAFSQIAITGPGPIGFNVIAPTSLPTQFSLPIPVDADCGN